MQTYGNTCVGAQQLCQYSPPASACSAMYRFVILNYVFYFLWFSGYHNNWIQCTCKCGRTHTQNAGVEKLSHALIPSYVFLVFPEYLSYSQEKVSFLSSPLSDRLGEPKTALGRLNYETYLHGSMQLPLTEYPIRFYLVWFSYSYANILVRDNSKMLWEHAYVSCFSCFVQLLLNFLGQKGNFLCLILIKSWKICFYCIASLLLQLPWIDSKLPLFGLHINTHQWTTRKSCENTRLQLTSQQLFSSSKDPLETYLKQGKIFSNFFLSFLK